MFIQSFLEISHRWTLRVDPHPRQRTLRGYLPSLTPGSDKCLLYLPVIPTIEEVIENRRLAPFHLTARSKNHNTA